MNASVASRTRQYGIMRSIGMGANQLYKMIAEKNNQTREVIGARAALRHAERAKAGEYLMQKGEWKKKQ